MWSSPSKKTRSPGCSSSRGTDTAAGSCHCATVLCGSEMPSWPNTYWTRPEQSKPRGVAPAHTYGSPRYCNASETTALVLEGDREDAAARDAPAAPAVEGG